MSLSALAHLNFDGQAREALEFYASVFGGKATITTYGDFGMPPEVPGADRVVFGQVDADNGFRVLAYDVPAHSDDVPLTTGTTHRADGTTLTTQPFFLSVNAETADEAGGCGRGSPWAPPSSSRSGRRSGHPPSACSPTASASPGSSAPDRGA